MIYYYVFQDGNKSSYVRLGKFENFELALDFAMHHLVFSFENGRVLSCGDLYDAVNSGKIVL